MGMFDKLEEIKDLPAVKPRAAKTKSPKSGRKPRVSKSLQELTEETVTEPKQVTVLLSFVKNDHGVSVSKCGNYSFDVLRENENIKFRLWAYIEPISDIRIITHQQDEGYIYTEYICTTSDNLKWKLAELENAKYQENARIERIKTTEERFQQLMTIESSSSNEAAVIRDDIEIKDMPLFNKPAVPTGEPKEISLSLPPRKP